MNKLGYATESRNKEIDPELMGYMTGTGLKAYTVTNVTYGNNAGDIPSITLTEIPKANVMDKATDGDHKGYIIYNTDAAVIPEGATEGTKAVLPGVALRLLPGRSVSGAVLPSSWLSPVSIGRIASSSE